MHYLVRMLVEADNAREAVAQAETDCDRMVEQSIIDWYDMNGRWGESKAYGINSQKGQALLKEGMENNRRQFDEAMKAIRYMMESFTDDQIYNEQFTREEQDKAPCYLSRYQFSIADGRSNNASVYCMDGSLWGSRLDKDTDLEYILNNNEDKKLWVVPVDVHN